jgi:hypothetical protein
MRLDVCWLADAATGTPDGKLFIHGGGITRLSPPQLPWVHPMLALVLRFQIDRDDANQPHEIGLQIVAPDGTQLLSPAPAVAVDPGRPIAVEGEETYLQAVVQLAGLVFASAGIFTFNVSVDADIVRALPVAVVAPLG